MCWGILANQYKERRFPKFHQKPPFCLSFYLIQIDFAVFLFIVGNEFQHQLDNLTVGRPARVAADIAKFCQNISIHPQAKVLLVITIHRSFAPHKANMTLF